MRPAQIAAAATIIATTIGAIATVSQEAVMKAAFLNWGYFLTLALVIAWGISAHIWLQNRGNHIKLELIKHRWGIGFCLLAAIFVFCSVPVQYKVLSDEANLVSVAIEMSSNHSAGQPIIDYVYHQAHHPERIGIPIRPLVFPFFVSLVYPLAADGLQAAFIVNGLALFGFLSLVYLAVARRLDRMSAVAAVLLLLSQPVLTTTAASAGFDILSILLLTASVWLYLGQNHNPHKDQQVLLWMTLLMFANVRYEAGLICCALILGLIVAKRFLWSDILCNPMPYVLSLPLMLPMVWQRILSRNKMEAPDGELLFDLRRVVDHGWLALESLVDFRFVLPYNNIANMLGLCICVGLTYWYLRYGRTNMARHHKSAVWTVVITAVSISMLYLIHDKGKVNFPTSARLFLIPTLILSGVPILTRVIWPQRVKSGLLLVVGIIFVTIYHPVAVKNTFMNKLTLVRRTTITTEFLQEHLPDNGLIISERPIHYVAMGYGSIGFKDLKNNVNGVLNHIRCGDIPRAIIAQRLSHRHETVLNNNNIPEDIPTKVISEVRVQGPEFLRFLEIDVDVDPVGERSCSRPRAPRL